MRKLCVHTIESAPEMSRQTLRGLEQKFGFLPNVLATMAASPVLLDGFVGGFGSFHGGSFDEAEKQVLLLTNAVALGCPWTIAAHSTFALEDGVAAADVAAIRGGGSPAEPKYRALARLTRALLATRGEATDPDVGEFLAAGYSQVQIFEVILGVGISTMTATTTNFAGTPVEERFRAQAWAPAPAR